MGDEFARWGRIAKRARRAGERALARQRSGELRRARETVYLVGCSGEKLDHRSTARELYASPLFRAARNFVEGTGSPWAILSAKHGLVLPDQVLDPYDLSAGALKALGGSAIRAWGASVLRALEAAFPNAKRFVFLAGSGYRDAVSGLARSRVLEPLRGLGIGERLRWLRERGERHVLASAIE